MAPDVSGLQSSSSHRTGPHAKSIDTSSWRQSARRSALYAWSSRRVKEPGTVPNVRIVFQDTSVLRFVLITL